MLKLGVANRVDVILVKVHVKLHVNLHANLHVKEVVKQDAKRHVNQLVKKHVKAELKDHAEQISHQDLVGKHVEEFKVAVDNIEKNRWRYLNDN